MAFGINQDFDIQDASMRAFNPRNLLRVDWLLPLIVLCLAAAGWMTLYSAAQTKGMSIFYKQIGWFIMGAGIAAMFVCIDYRALVSLGPAMYVVVNLLLLAVIFMSTGVARKGSERWLELGPVVVQPSEFSKLAMIFALAWYFSTLGPRIRKLRWFILTFVIAAVPIVLILKQPNLGTAACLGPLVLAMLYVAGCRTWHLLAVLIAGFSLVPFLWLQLHDFNPAANPVEREKQREQHRIDRKFYELHWHQKMRIYGFAHPEADLRQSGWQTYQSKITVGSGGLSGKGFLQSTQTRLKYLPEYHTDFIFSLLAEERGFIGAATVIGLFMALLLRGLSFARGCHDMMGALLATGVVVVLAFHVFVNIAITVGIMPVTGIPLPFLSYGGSFYLTTMAGIGVLLNVPIQRRMFVR